MSGSRAASIRSTSAQHATETPIGPNESSELESGTPPCIGMRLAVGLKPVRPHSADGMRIEPPVSVPSATAAMPSATDAAAPDDEPPAIR